MGSGVEWKLPHHPAPKKLFTFRHLPIRGEIFRLGERGLKGWLAWKLRSIHPNPGPRDRNKSEEGKAARRERRRRRRQEKREVRQAARQAEVREMTEIVVVAWNVQRMSLVSREKRKARAVAEYARRCGWDVVLLSEVWAEGEGVVWMGEEGERGAIVYGEKAAVLLRGEVLRAWCAEGSRMKISPRHVSVKVKGVTLTATYLPVRVVGREMEAEEEMERLEEHVQWSERDELVIVGGDFNAHVGAGEERRGVCGKFGLRTSNQAGKDFISWCETAGLCHVNSFYRHKRRGSWFSNIHRRWYELDGFVMRREERAKHVKRVNTVGEASVSDHKPKKMVVSLKKRKWRKVNRKRAPRVKWEALREEEVARHYHRRMGEKMAEPVEAAAPGEGESTEWGKLAEKVMEVAEEVCGLKTKSVENPWMLGKQEKIAETGRRVSAAVERRNEVVGGGEEEALVEEAKQRLKEARRER